MISISVQDVDGIDKHLAGIAIEVRQIALRKGIANAAKLVVNRAKELVPKPGYPGDKPDLKPLRDTIGYITKVYELIVVAIVGPQRPAGAHGHLVHGGTKPHEIMASAYVSKAPLGLGNRSNDLRGQHTRDREATKQRKKALASSDSIFDVFGIRVQHPGAKANPFLQSAADETAAAQQKAITDAIDSYIVSNDRAAA